MRGDLKRKILGAVLEKALLPAELMLAIHEAGHGASRRTIEKKFRDIQTARDNFTNSPERRISLSNTLQKLKNDGLVERRAKGWIATRLGREFLESLIAKPSRRAYPANRSNSTIIVIFDVPEEVKYKRDWLRDCLKNMGFKMIQKSVWSGRVSLPQEFIKDLERYRIIQYVDIFQATKLGSLTLSNRSLNNS